MNEAAGFRLFNPPGSPPTLGFSHVGEVSSGRLVFTAGQVPVDAAGALVGRGDFAAQAEQAFANLETVLTYEGTEEMHALSLGQAVTGIAAFR